ncbi:MAG TPA: hypothetical protein VM925_10615, partial [Labilithrix sp.]|nr:hypothetical protein [Labilithrix sp.]
MGRWRQCLRPLSRRVNSAGSRSRSDRRKRPPSNAGTYLFGTPLRSSIMTTPPGDPSSELSGTVKVSWHRFLD